MRLLWVVVLLVGCGRSRLVNPPPPVDAAADADASIDAPIDTGVDAPVMSVSLETALTCGLDEDSVVRAAARWVNCNPDFTGSVQTVVEAWEGFVLGSLDPFAASSIGLPGTCSTWTCAASAGACDEFMACEAEAVAMGPCVDGEFRCVGDELARCRDGQFRAHLDCGELGATCAGGACDLEGCRFGGVGATRTGCEVGDITLCGGGLRVDCADLGADRACALFAIGGEIPVEWCAPEGMSADGASPAARVDCEGSVVSFESVLGTLYSIDCVELGYMGCDDRGCI